MKRWDLFAEVTGWVKVGTVEADTWEEAEQAAAKAQEEWEWPEGGTFRQVSPADIHDGAEWSYLFQAEEQEPE
jgi:hypothetical protein